MYLLHHIRISPYFIILLTYPAAMIIAPRGITGANTLRLTIRLVIPNFLHLPYWLYSPTLAEDSDHNGD
jgi:hypothetical protein